MSDASPLSDQDRYLARLGERVREERARRGMTRRALARDAGLSERYLAQLESGHGNISIVLLRRLADALNQPLSRLVGEDGDAPELRLVVELLRRLGSGELAAAHALLAARFAPPEIAARHHRIALIGLRGAGKSTLGSRLASHLGVPFIELDAGIEGDFGLSLAEIFALYGQPAYRRSERRVFDDILARTPRFVLAAGGSIVAEPATFQHLLTQCFTIWLRADPEAHMARVQAQGDLRPMAGSNGEAMAELRRILAARSPLYAKADAAVDTSAGEVETTLRALLAALPEAAVSSAPMNHVASLAPA